MRNVFLDYAQKSKFVFGVIISIITSILVLKTAVEYSEIIMKDWIFLPITALIFVILFMAYIKIKGDKYE